VATNFYFSNFSNSMEQTLIEDLIIESIRIYGLDCWYIPRTLGAKDDLLNEDDLPIFDQAYMIEMYVKNVEGFEGDGQFLSKFGLQIRDSMTLSVSMRRFSEDVALYNEQIRPNEGDLIYFPLTRKMYEVMFVDNKPIFYQLGALQMYDLRCELMEYSNEVFNTGVEEIDIISANRLTTANNTIAGIESLDPLADNLTIETVADGILDFTEENPFGEENY
jgi:Virus neck protein